MKYLLLIEPKRRNPFYFQEVGSPAIVEVPCAMYFDSYLKRDVNTWELFRAKPHKFLSHVMQSQSVKCHLQNSLEDTLKKNLRVASPRDLKFGQERRKKPVKEAVCLRVPVLKGDPDTQHRWWTPAVSETLYPQDTVESPGGTSKKC